MKKLFVLIAGLGFSVAASAGQLTAGGATGSTTTVTSASNCTLLTEDVDINLSANVEGGYDCNTTTNTVGIATCHPNGRDDASGNNYFYIGSSAGGSVSAPTTRDADCSAANAETKAEGAAS